MSTKRYEEQLLAPGILGLEPGKYATHLIEAETGGSTHPDSCHVANVAHGKL